MSISLSPLSSGTTIGSFSVIADTTAPIGGGVNFTIPVDGQYALRYGGSAFSTTTGLKSMTVEIRQGTTVLDSRVLQKFYNTTGEHLYFGQEAGPITLSVGITYNIRITGFSAGLAVDSNDFWFATAFLISGSSSTLKDYLFGERNTGQGSFGNGSDVIFNNLQTSRGSGISLNTNAGVITLIGGKTYKLTASLLLEGFSLTDGHNSYGWVDSSNVQLPFSTLANQSPVTRTNSNVANQGTAIAIITPTSTTTVKLRSVGANGTVTIIGNYSWVMIEEL